MIVDFRSVFMEHNRQKIISTGVEREKKRLEEVKKSGKTSGGDASPNECGRTAWTEYLFSAIENTCRRPLDCRASSGLQNLGGDRCFFRSDYDG